MIRKHDGLLITAVERTVQEKGTVDNQNFQTQLIPCTSPVDDHARNGAVKATVRSLGRAALGVSILPTSWILPISELSQKQIGRAIKWQNFV